MSFLPDVNVWIALVSDRHVHHRAAAEWVSDAGDDTVALCRVAHMGFLRLLTHEKVMGQDVVSSAQAWCLADEMLQDPRFYFLAEPERLETAWRRRTEKPGFSPHGWTDAYLGAFAESAGLRIVTFDKRLASNEKNTVLL